MSIRPIKPAAPADDLPALLSRDAVRLIGDHLRATNISALALVHAAYKSEFADRDQIVGTDGWITSERFDLEARAGMVLAETPTFPPLPAAAERMLRQVMEQRFQLRVRRETRALERYVLGYARADRALRPGIQVAERSCTDAAMKPDGDCAYRPGAGTFSMKGRPLAEFVDYLSRPAYAGGRVVDETGITGPLDIDFEWMLDFRDLLASRANLTTALREQLGLKLEHRRLPLPVLVIEHIQRPSGN